MNWFEDQIKNRLQNDQDDFSRAFCDLSSIVMGEEAAKAGLITSRQKINNAIQEILKFYDQDIIPVPDNITDTDQYINYCIRPSGIMKRKVELTDMWYRNAFGPMLAMLQNGDAVALLPSAKGYSYFDYERNKRVFINGSTAKNIQTTAYCFYKPFPARPMSVLDLLKYMFAVVTKSDVIYYTSILLFTTLLGLIQPKVSLLLFSYIIPQGAKNLLWLMGIMIFSLSLSGQILSHSKNLIMTRLTLRLNNTIEPAVMMRMLNLPVNFFKRYASGELSQKFSMISSICNSIFMVITGTLLTALFSLAYLSQIANITPMLIPPALLILGSTLAVNIGTSLASVRLQKRYLYSAAALSGFTYSIISGIQKIKLTGSEKRVFSRWAAKYKDTAYFTYNPPFLLKYSSVINAVISFLGLAVVYSITLTQALNMGEFMAFNTAFGMVSASVMSLCSLTTFFSGLKPKLDILAPIMKSVPEISGNKTVINSLSGSVDIQNLSFRYNENGKNILDSINITVRPGQYVAIVGKTGCGKSTLVRLLLGFETPNKGAIYYDGKDITKLDLPSLRRNIGAVTQNGKLFNGDIYSNITVSSPTLTLKDAWEAAAIADIAEDIKSMPMGMHTVITEGSGSISGGQKQRLMIARAIAAKPKILIFDESTSALDNITQRHVSDALSKLKCTRIAIAHRLSTIKDCDMIYVLNEGKIAEQGTFDELYEKKGIFCELVKRQMVEEE